MKIVTTSALLIAALGFSTGVICAESTPPAAAAAAEAATAPVAPVAPASAADTRPGSAADLCVSLARIQSTRIIDDRTIVFEMSGNKMLVNHLPRRCPGLKPQKGFGYRTSLSQLCNTDIIWVLENYGGGGVERGASCGLGKFEAYVQPETVTAPDANGKLESAPKS